ncbi:hypothetical protein NDU88_007395 [Pleurodeles waltl]|uniref:Uncharacterized protein n=1 Tax=Pleurodeles waltl TaxID=8319 RepID=A0AAV7NX96_PLEWA|nr:hypothetical protein NDU88_007395 [Pleurodeles waltl]
MDYSSKVLQALKMLQDEGREDLLQDGVLEQAWVGSRRLKRASSDGVAATVIACTSPARKTKKNLQKSVAGMRITTSPEHVSAGRDNEGCGCRRGGKNFARRSGTSIRQRVVARGRGAFMKCAVAEDSRLRDCGVSVHALVVTHVDRAVKKQALLPSVIMSERGEGALEERELGTALKMAAPTAEHRDIVIVVSDNEEEEHTGEGSFSSGFEFVNVPVVRQDGGRLQLVPRLVSPMLHKVQEWDVNNQTICQTGQCIEFAEKGGLGMRGLLYGESDVSGKAGRAQFRLNFWQPGSSVLQPGCGGKHAMGGHEEQLSSVWLGWPADNQRMSVDVRTPPRHRSEDRARPGAARLISGDAFLPVPQNVNHLINEEQSTSWSAGCAEWNVDKEEELLDYEDGDKPEAVDLGQQRGREECFGVQTKCKRGRSFGVFQETTKRAVRSDCHGGGS